MDKRPKRYKEKDNPYVLESIEKEEKYYISFKSNNVSHKVKVSKEIFNVFDESEKTDNNNISSRSKHIHKFELTDEELNEKMSLRIPSIDEYLIDKELHEELKKAIQELPDIEKIRLNKYYFQNKTYEQIAKEEKVNKSSVKRSIDIALKKIYKKIKN